VYRVEEEKAEKSDAKGESKSNTRDSGLQAAAKVVPVTLGIETRDKVELLSGPNEGDTIVLDGGYGLSDGAKVEVKDKAKQ
jgi:multidrug efflux pump subunit AcrA (membrane-fusion protein)